MFSALADCVLREPLLQVVAMLAIGQKHRNGVEVPTVRELCAMLVVFVRDRMPWISRPRADKMPQIMRSSPASKASTSLPLEARIFAPSLWIVDPLDETARVMVLLWTRRWQSTTLINALRWSCFSVYAIWICMSPCFTTEDTLLPVISTSRCPWDQLCTHQ